MLACSTPSSYNISKKFSFQTYPALTSPQPTNQPRGELICPSKKKKPPLACADTSDWSPPRAKILSYGLQPTGPSPEPETSCSRTTSKVHRYSGEERGRLPRKRPFFHHVNNVERDQAAQREFPPHPGAACGRPVSLSCFPCPLSTLPALNLTRSRLAGVVMSRLTIGWGQTGWG